MVPLTAPQAAALAAIRAAFPDSDVVLIGALALGHHIPMEHRTTDDLDLAVAMPMEGFPGPLERWERHRKMQHRFFSDEGQMVDVLPAGRELIEQGFVEWPDGEQMSLVGLDLAFAHHTREEAGDTTVLVPTAPVMAFLKMRAWLDRPEIRQKDLGDFAYLLVGYVGDDDDRRFEDEIFDLGLDFEDISPFLLGSDLRQIMSSQHRSHAMEFMHRVTPEKLAAHGPSSWRDADDAERALAQFRNGLGD